MSTMADVAYILQTAYAEWKPPDSAKRKRPWWMRMNADKRKDQKDWSGDGDFKYALKHTNGQGVAATFATAKANRSNTAGEQFVANPRKKYGYGQVDGDFIDATRSNKHTFLKGVRNEIDGLLEEHSDTLAFEVFRDGSGRRGTIESVNGNEFTLTDRNEVRNFKKNMVIVGDNNATGLSPVATTMTVVAINRTDGIVEVDAVAGGVIAGFHLFREDDSTDTVMEGMQTIIPETAGTFRGVDCTTDRELLAGVFLDDTGSSIEDCAGEVAVTIGQNTSPEELLLILNPLQAYAVTKRQGAKVFYDGGGRKAQIGFATFEINVPGYGPMQLMTDPHCPMDDGWVVDPSTWFYKASGESPHVWDEDTLQQLRVNDDDAIEFRSKNRGNLICDDPGKNGRFKIAA